MFSFLTCLGNRVFDHLLIEETAINDFAPKVDIAVYKSKDAIRVYNGWYQAFTKDIQDIKTIKK